MLSRGSSAKWRSPKACIPSQIASSEVETSITRTLQRALGESARRSRSAHATPVALSFAPGTTRRERRCPPSPRRSGAEQACPPAPAAAPGAAPRRPQPGRRRSATSAAGSCRALDQPGAAEDQLRDRRVEDAARVRGVVVGDEDDRALGVGGAELADHVVGRGLGSRAQPALAGRHVVDQGGRAGGPEAGASDRRPRSAASPAAAAARRRGRAATRRCRARARSRPRLGAQLGEARRSTRRPRARPRRPTVVRSSPGRRARTATGPRRRRHRALRPDSWSCSSGGERYRELKPPPGGVDVSRVEHFLRIVRDQGAVRMRVLGILMLAGGGLAAVTVALPPEAEGSDPAVSSAARSPPSPASG